MVQQLPFPRIQVGEVKIQVKETRKHLKAHIRHQKPYHARWFTTFQVRTGCLTFWKVTRRGAFFVCTMCMPLRWEYPVWTFHPPKSPSLGLFAFLFPKKAWSLWELVGRSLSIRTATGVSTVRHSPVDPGTLNPQLPYICIVWSLWYMGNWMTPAICLHLNISQPGRFSANVLGTTLQPCFSYQLQLVQKNVVPVHICEWMIVIVLSTGLGLRFCSEGLQPSYNTVRNRVSGMLHVFLHFLL